LRYGDKLLEIPFNFTKAFALRLLAFRLLCYSQGTTR